MKQIIYIIIVSITLMPYKIHAQNQAIKLEKKDSMVFFQAINFYRNLHKSKLPDTFNKILGITGNDTIQVTKATKIEPLNGNKGNTFYTFSLNNMDVEIISKPKKKSKKNPKKPDFNECFGIRNFKTQSVDGCKGRIMLKSLPNDSLSIYTELNALIGPIPVNIDASVFILNKEKVNERQIHWQDKIYLQRNGKWILKNEIDIPQAKTLSTNELMIELKLKKTEQKSLKMTLTPLSKSN